MEKTYFSKALNVNVNGVEFLVDVYNLYGQDDEIICKESVYVGVYLNTDVTKVIYEFLIQDYEIEWDTIENDDKLFEKLLSIISLNIKDAMNEDLFFSDDVTIAKELGKLKTEMGDVINSINTKTPKDALIDVRKFFNKNASFMRDADIFKLIDDLDLTEYNKKQVEFFNEN